MYRGGERDPAKDALLGFFTIELEGLIATDRLKGEFSLQAPSRAPFAPPGASLAAHAYAGAVAAEVRPSDALEAFMLGGRVLRLAAPVELRDVPPAWLPPAPAAPPHEAAKGGKGAPPHAPAAPAGAASAAHGPAALAAAADDDASRHRFALTLSLPGAALEGGSPAPPRVLAFCGGRLRFAYAGAPEDAPAGSRLALCAPSRPPSAPAGGSSKPGSAKKEAPPLAAKADAHVAGEGGGGARPPSAGSGGDAGGDAGGGAGGRWVVAWSPPACRAFLGPASVAALHAHFSGGGALALGVRRLSVAAVAPVAALLRGGGTGDAAAAATAAALALHAAAAASGLRLPGGVRLLEEVAAFRGAAAAPCDALLAPGATAAPVEAALAPAPPAAEELAAAAAEGERRAAAFASAEAAVGGGGGAAKPGSAKKPAAAAPASKPASAKGKGGAPAGAEAAAAAAAADTAPHPFLAAGTHIALTLALSSPLAPAPPPPPAVSASDLVPPRAAPPAAPPPLNAAQALRRDVANAAAVIAEEYLRLGGGEVVGVVFRAPPHTLTNPSLSPRTLTLTNPTAPRAGSRRAPRRAASVWRVRRVEGSGGLRC